MSHGRLFSVLLLTLIYMQSDKIMLLNILNSEAVGLYAAASRISEAIYFIPMVISAAFLPRLSVLITDSKKDYHQLLQKIYSLMTLFVFVYIIFIFFFAEIIILKLLGYFLCIYRNIEDSFNFRIIYFLGCYFI